MKAKDIKEQLFGDFIKWLDDQGIGDHFSMDIWMTKCWEALYHQFVEKAKQTEQQAMMINRAPLNVLEDVVKKKKDAQENAKKQQEAAKKKIEEERKKVVSEKNEGFKKENK